jgi:hypothetical protein
MDKKNKDLVKARLPREAQAMLRSRDGTHGTAKGRRGYNRLAEKRSLRDQLHRLKPTKKRLAFLMRF